MQISERKEWAGSNPQIEIVVLNLPRFGKHLQPLLRAIRLARAVSPTLIFIIFFELCHIR
jgi:hypothetical protein